MDAAKYRDLFLEEATEHLAEMSRALLAVEKDPGAADALEILFRMGHSIKGMAASLGYSAIAELAHLLEDRIGAARARGALGGGGDLALLFRGLDALERMVAGVRERGEEPPLDSELAGALRAADAASGAPEKKARRPR